MSSDEAPAAKAGLKEAEEVVAEVKVRNSAGVQVNATPADIRAMAPQRPGVSFCELMDKRGYSGRWKGHGSIWRSWGGSTGRTQSEARELVLNWLIDLDKQLHPEDY